MINGVLITLAELCVLILIFALLNKLIKIGLKFSLTRLFKSNSRKFSQFQKKIGLFFLFSCSGLCLFLLAGNGLELKAEYPDVLEPTQVKGIEEFVQDNLLLPTLTKVNTGQYLYILTFASQEIKAGF
jgi:hypothetical protein